VLFTLLLVMGGGFFAASRKNKVSSHNVNTEWEDEIPAGVAA
jgi:hypothetical protein